MSLHEELQRIADAAPRPSIDHSVWDRGRSLRRRDRLATTAVAMVTVLTLGGLVALVTGPPLSVGPAHETVPEGAIPSRVVDVPQRFVTGPESEFSTVSWSDDVVQRDLAIGRASAAFSTGEIGSLPVAVTAHDGVHHPLSLPGWMGAGTINDSSGPTGLAVSPDGRRLAYAWWDPTAPLDRPMPAGVRIVDLATGGLQTITLEGGNGVRVRTIAWSPDSRWLTWSGEQLASWTPHSSGGGTMVVGRVEPGGTTQEAIPVDRSRRSVGDVAITNDGSLALGLESGGILLDAEKREARKLPRTDGPPGAFSPDGTVLALETRTPAPLSSSVRLDDAEPLRHPFPDDTIGPATVRPLGWLDDRLQLLLVQEPSAGDAELVVTTPSLSQTSTWRRSVGTVAPGAAESLSLAVDLIPDLDGTSSQQLTHDFDAPDWPGRIDVSWQIGLGLAGTLLVLCGLWWWRRRTPQRLCAR